MAGVSIFIHGYRKRGVDMGKVKNMQERGHIFLFLHGRISSLSSCRV